MELRAGLLGRSKILFWAGKYNVNYDIPIENLGPEVKERGYLTKTELVKLACRKLPDRWKRGKDEGKLGLVKTNSPDDVKRFTRDAFLSTEERHSIRCLMWRTGGLPGVGSAIGSAILHWFHDDCYPIWDINARWSVQIDKNYCSFTRWKAYTLFCRDIADEYEVCMRTLDRALFKYGQANRPSSC